MKKILTKLAGIFNDTNDINEQSVIGAISFAIMIIYSIVDVTTGIFGKDLQVKQYIYDGFQNIAIAAFGIGAVKSVFK